MKPFALIAAVVLLASCRCPVAEENNRDIALAILSDKTLDRVDEMGRELLGKGFNAGSFYSEVWIRDLNTFIETSLEVGNPADVKEALKVFFVLQQRNGEIVDGWVLSTNTEWSDPNTYSNPSDTAHIGFKNTVETDQETSLVQAVRKYVERTGDRAFLDESVCGKTVLERLADAMDYLFDNKLDSGYGLLTGALTADWGDVEDDPGNCVDIGPESTITIDIYDNAMMVIALRDLEWLSVDEASRQKWSRMRRDFESRIRRYLWDGRKFIPHLYPMGNRHEGEFDEKSIYYHGGTAIAIEAGLLSRKEISRVNEDMLSNVKASGMTSIGLTVYPPYPKDFFPGGMANPYIYQNGGDWTWFGGRMIQQLVRYGFVAEAYQEIRPMIDRVLVNGDFREYYGPGGVPMGASAFKGSAGVLCKAISMLRTWASLQVLPDPLERADGGRVKTAAQWTESRRADILEMFSQEMYGHVPSRPDALHFETLSEETVYDGLGLRKVVRIFLDAARAHYFDVLLHLPSNADAPVPVFAGLNFYGNDATLEGGRSSGRWPYEQILRSGWGVATAWRDSIEPDVAAGSEGGVRSWYNPEGDWGAISAWAWGLSRIFDYLETEGKADASRVVAIGHSRLGKTALWAVANDLRFAGVVSNDSGCCGAAISRRKVGETFKAIDSAFPHWFTREFDKYMDREEDFPGDQHWLCALSAPRPLYVASASEDTWADPFGEWLSARAAGEVYALFGYTGIGERYPLRDTPDHGERVSYHVRSGVHDITAWDWAQYISFFK